MGIGVGAKQTVPHYKFTMPEIKISVVSGRFKRHVNRCEAPDARPMYVNHV